MNEDDTCYYAVDRGVRVHIPGCMGAAVHGPDRCTCKNHKKERIQILEEKVEKLEKQMRELIARYSNLEL